MPDEIKENNTAEVKEVNAATAEVKEIINKKMVGYNQDDILEVSNKANVASEHRLNISEKLSPLMKELKQELNIHLMAANKDINFKDNDDPKVKALKSIFPTVKDHLYYKGGWPKDTTPARLESIAKKISMIVKWFNYIGKETVYQNYFNQYGITVSVSKLEDDNAYYNNENVKKAITSLFEDSQNVQKNICEQADEIKINKFEELPDNIKYCAKLNKSGIKASDFNKITTLSAIKQRKENAAKKKLEKMSENDTARMSALELIEQSAEVIVNK